MTEYRVRTCYHVQPGYHSPAPVRCFLALGHMGNHRANNQNGGPAPEWENEGEDG